MYNKKAWLERPGYAGTVNPVRVFPLAVAVLLAGMGAVQVVTALGETQTWDEGIHISAGCAYWQRGDYSWNTEHPPLVKLMSAAVLLPLHPVLPTEGENWKQHNQVQMGVDFLYRNRVPAGTLLFLARATTILLTLLGGLLLALWMRRRFGAPAAVLALALYACDPNLIAHGRYVTTDVPMAVFFFLTCTAWCEYLLSGRRRDLLLAALAFAVALVVKFSALLLAPAIALLYAIRWVQSPAEFPLRRLALTVAVTGGACAAVVGAAYGPETLHSLHSGAPKLHRTLSRHSTAGEALYQVSRRLGLPRHQFFLGLEEVATHNAGGHSTYLLGRLSDSGWWYYFPVVFAVKSTVAALAATLLLLAAGVWSLARWRPVPFPLVALLLPAGLYFLVSTTSGINLGVRHILPVYPALYAAAAAVLAAPAAGRALRTAGVALALLQAGECASIYPDYLAFFNFPSGGPGNGPHYLVDSNIDWGQDVIKLRRWLEAHGTRKVYINYFGKADLPYYGIEEASPPAANDRKGWDELDGFAAASVTPLHGVYVPLPELEPLRRLPVTAKVGYSIYVYDLRKTMRRQPTR